MRLLSHIFHKQVKRIGGSLIFIWKSIRLRNNHDFWLIHFTQQLYTCWINLQFPHMHLLMSFVTFRHMHVTRHMIMWVTCILYLNFKSGGNITGWLILPKRPCTVTVPRRCRKSSIGVVSNVVPDHHLMSRSVVPNALDFSTLYIPFLFPINSNHHATQIAS